MKSYYVLHVRIHGFWIVACNDHGHYRNCGRYSSRNAAVKAADQLNTQQRGEPAHAINTFAIGAL